MKCFCTILFLLSCHFLQAQFDPSKVNPKAAQLFSKARELTDGGYLGKLDEAIDALEKAVKIDNQFADAYLSLGGMYQEKKNYQAAIDNYEKAKKIDSLYFKDYNLPYSINLAGLGEFDKALDAVNSFLSIENLNESSRKAGEYRRKCYQFAIDYEKTKKSAIINLNHKIWGTASTRLFPNIIQASA